MTQLRNWMKESPNRILGGAAPASTPISAKCLICVRLIATDLGNIPACKLPKGRQEPGLGLNLHNLLLELLIFLGCA
jgi:hypothetical protein